jgi:translocation and assembly module TamB
MRPGVAGGVARRLGAAIGVFVVFVTAAVAGLVLHVNTPAAQRAIVQRVNALLAPIFFGRLIIDRVGGVGLTHVDFADARVEDPDGQLVIGTTGLTAHIDTVTLLRSLVSGGDIVVDIPKVSIASAHVVLDADTVADLRIGKAFVPRSTSAPGGPPGRNVRLTIPDIHIAHAAVSGQPAGLSPIDAEVDDTDGSLLFVSNKLTLDVKCARWAGRGVPGLPDEHAHGDAVLHLGLPSDSGRALGLHVTTHGVLGAIAVNSDVAYDSGDLDVSADLPPATPEQVRALLPAWPFVVPVRVHADAHGTVSGTARLMTHAHASFGASALDLEGPVTLAPALGASFHVDARKIDVSAFAPSAPPSDLAATGDVSVVTKPDGAFDAKAVLDVGPGLIGPAQTPAIGFTADFARGPSPGGEVTATAHGIIHEPGAPTVVSARLVPAKGQLRVAFRAEANAPDLAQAVLLRSAGVPVRGRALAHVDGTIDLLRGTLDAQVAVSGEAIEAAGAHAKTAQVDVHVTGPLGAPSFQAQVSGDDVAIGGLQCASLSARARVRLRDGVTLEDVDLAANASEQHARVQAKLVRIGGDGVRIESAVMRGFGAPIEATVRYAPGRLYVKARTGELDLARIGRFTRVSLVQGGRVSLDVDAEATARAADGRVAVDVTKGAFAGLHEVDAHVEVTLHGHQAAGVVTARVADIGSLDVRSTSVQVGEAGPLSLSSWRRAWGAIVVNAHVDLPKLVAVLPRGSLPFSQVEGVFDVTARVARDSSQDTTPGFEGTASTTGLVLGGGAGPGAWRLEGVDPTLHVTVDDDTGATSVVASLRDAVGPIVEVTAESNAVPYGKIFEGQGATEALEAMPFDAHADVPGRKLQSLPPSLGLSDLRGELQANVDWHGALASPNLKVTATLTRGKVDPQASSLPVDFGLSGTYDGTQGTASLEATNKDKVVLDASAAFDARAPDVLAGFAGAAVPWTASARAKVDALPLRAFTFLSDRQVRGRASGELTIERLHDDAHASASIALEGLNVGEIACRSATVKASLDGHAFDASARLDQADEQDGYLEAHVHAGSRWGKALVPALDASQAAEITLAAKQFRAGLLYPFVSGVFASLDGRIDAAARIGFDPGGGGAHPTGTVKLTDGSFELAMLGGEFGDITAQLSLTPDGLITLHDAVAYGVTGKLEAAATARLNGFDFAGARATVQVPKNQAIPVIFDGVQMGMLDGHFDLTAALAPAHDALDVTVEVPTLHMDLPETGAHDVQALGDLDNVATGVMRGEQGFVDVPLDATVDMSSGVAPRMPIKLDVKLGKDVEVSRGPDLDVRLEGEPVVTIADEVRVGGQIRVVRGSIDINGKPFDIENGTVTFSGDDPSNPQVVLTAEWTAADATRVYADFSGPLKNGKVTLRSDPTLPGGENDIRALLLFGTTETDMANVSQQYAPAAGAAGGVATQPINRALSGVNRALDKLGLAGGISTKIDTSQANPRPEVEIQIARDISLQVAYVLGVPVPGSNPDTYYATLDWRFLRAWSLAATRGDQGTSILDLIWQHRY